MRTQAGRYAIITLFVILAPLVLWIVYHIRTPELWAGDELEVRECRWCGGSGNFEGESSDGFQLGYDDASSGGSSPFERCPGCGGTGKVRVIVPGENRPTRLKGIIVDAATSHEIDSYSLRQPRPGSGGFGVPGMPGVPGGIPSSGIPGQPNRAVQNAGIRFEHEDGEVIDVECNPYGLFHTKMRPGRYRVAIAAPGFQILEDTIVIPRLTEEIWLEESKTIEAPESAAHAQSLYGLELIAAIKKSGGLPGKRRGDQKPFVRVDCGSP